MRVCAVENNGRSYSGIVYQIVVQPCKDDDNRPHPLIFISEEKEFPEQDEEFGCIALWVDKLKRIDAI